MNGFVRVLGALLIALSATLPAQARFVTADPVPPDKQTGDNFNRYAYANNSPYVFVDPDGRIPILVPIVFGVTAYLASNHANAPALGGQTYSMSPVDQVSAALPPGRVLLPIKAAANADNGGYSEGGKFSRQTKRETAERANSQCEYCGSPTQPARKSTRG